jgi:predicted oxidoreductase
MEKEFGLSKREERDLTGEDTEREERRAQREKEGGVKAAPRDPGVYQATVMSLLR